MARDFTDYVVEVHGAGERVYYQDHFRQTKKDPEAKDFEYNGRMYLLNKDRATRPSGYTRHLRWKKWDRKHPFDSIWELTRSKKLGLVKYREPPPSEPAYREVEVEKDVQKGWECKLCGWYSQNKGYVEDHVAVRHKGAKPEVVIIPHMEPGKVMEKVPIYVEPYHISRIHQPSGAFR